MNDNEMNIHLKNLSGKLCALSTILREAHAELTAYTKDLNTPPKSPAPQSGTDFLQFLMHYEDRVVHGALTTKEFLNLFDIK